jgi:hypothetical protein
VAVEERHRKPPQERFTSVDCHNHCNRWGRCYSHCH